MESTIKILEVLKCLFPTVLNSFTVYQHEFKPSQAKQMWNASILFQNSGVITYEIFEI